MVKKINVLAIPETHIFKSRRRRVSEEKGGLIGEGCWELRAEQQGESGWREDEVREEMDGSPQKWEAELSQLTPLPSGGSLNLMGLNRIN